MPYKSCKWGMDNLTGLSLIANMKMKFNIILADIHTDYIYQDKMQKLINVKGFNRGGNYGRKLIEQYAVS